MTALMDRFNESSTVLVHGLGIRLQCLFLVKVLRFGVELLDPPDLGVRGSALCARWVEFVGWSVHDPAR